MSVTTSTYTTNSKLITVSGETTPVNIMSAVDTAITSLGWSQYDYMAAGDTTAYDYYNGKVIPSGTVVNNAGQPTTYTTNPVNTAGWYNTGIITASSTTSVYGSGFSISIYRNSYGGTNYALSNYISIQSYGNNLYVPGDTLTFNSVYDSYYGSYFNVVLTITAVNSTGPTITLSSAANLVPGIKYTATNGTGSFTGGTGTGVIGNLIGGTTYQYKLADGATTITNGTVTNLTPATISNEYNPIYTYVYRALCADNTTYKYLIIRWDPTKQQFFTSAATGWSLTTKIPVNETSNFLGTYGQGYDLKDCQILVSASQNHFMIWPWIRQSMGLWSAIWEFERIAPEDTTSACFAWTNSVILGKGTGNGNTPFVFPTYGTGLLPITNKGQTSALGEAYNYTYGWASSKTIVSAISVDDVSTLRPYGRAYNWSITKPFGAGLDTTTIKLASGGWPDANGTDTTCLILPLHSGNETSSSSSSFTINSAGRPQNNGYAAVTGLADMVLIGVNAWLACGSSGLRTYDTTQTTAGGTTVTRYSTNYIDRIVFDGFRTIYGIYVAGGGTNLVRIDTETYNASTVTLPYAARGLAIDGKFVYVTYQDGVSSNYKIAMISRWVTSDGSTGTGFALVKTLDTLNSYGITHMFPDNLGNIIAVASSGGYTLSSSSMTMYKCSASGNVMGNSPAIPVAYGGTVNYGVAYWVAFYFDSISGTIYQASMCHGGSGTYGPWYAAYYSFGASYPTPSQLYNSHVWDSKYLTYYQLKNNYQIMGQNSGSSCSIYMGFNFNSSAGSYSLFYLQSIKPYRGMLYVPIEVRGSVVGTSYTPNSSGYYSNTLSIPVIGGTPVAQQLTNGNSLINVQSSGYTPVTYGTLNSLYTQGTTAIRNYAGNAYYFNKLYDMNYTDGTASGRMILKG